MSSVLALIVLLAPQEDGAPRARDAVFGLPGFQSKPPAEPAQDPAPPESFMSPRVKREAEDYKGLLEHNIFSPPRKKEAAPRVDNKPDGPKAPEGPRTRTWVVTGIVYNAAEKRYEALIEDPQAREGKYCKPGDTVAGATITEVTFDQVTVLRGEASSVLKLKDTLTEKLAPGAPAPGSGKVLDSSEEEKVRERMKNRHRRDSVAGDAEEPSDDRKKPK